MARSDSQIDNPQRGHAKRAEMLDVNINIGTQSINSDTEHEALVVIIDKQIWPMETLHISKFKNKSWSLRSEKYVRAKSHFPPFLLWSHMHLQISIIIIFNFKNKRL